MSETFRATQAIATFVSSWDGHTASADLLARAKALVVDYVAVAVGAVHHELVPIVGAVIDRHPQGTAALVGGGRASPADAAFFNGTLAHALEFDDSTLNPVGHPGCIILPALFALADQRTTGRQLLEAWLVGLEVHSRLGQAQRGNWSFAGGWLPIGHISLMGAAAGCARLLKLSADQVAHALGLAAQFCGQLSVNSGSQAKPLGAGHSARAGLIAARMAAHGAHAVADVIERPGGFADTFFGTGSHALEALQTLGAPHHLEEIGVAIKRYPSCYACHWGLDALLELLQQHDIRADDVRSVVHTHPANAAFCDNPAPSNEEEAKFSHEYNLAVALARGIPGIHDYSPAAMADPVVRAALAKVRTAIHSDTAEPKVARSYQVRVELLDGRSFSHEVARPLGHPRRPMDQAELTRKFRHCVEAQLGPQRAASLAELIGRLDADAAPAQIMAIVGGGRA